MTDSNWTRGTYAGHLATDIDDMYRRPRVLEIGELDALRLLAMLNLEQAHQVAEEDRAQRRQALVALVGGLLVLILVVVAAGI